jgi:hypothetical protein
MQMIAPDQVDKIATEVAQANLSAQFVERVFSEPMVDSEGHDALQLTIVIKPGVVDKLSGDTVLDTLVDIQRGLEKAGEERLAIVRYTTEEELSLSDDQS